MSLHSVLKNIYSYLEVLEVAHTDKVKLWGSDSLKDAVRWAAYAEEIYKQACGKPYKEELKLQIDKMRQLKIWRLGSLSVSFQLLESAEQNLTMALLQNPHLRMNVFELLIRRSTGLQNKDIFFQQCHELCQGVYLPEFAKTVQCAANSECNLPTGDCHTMAQARLLVQFLMRKMIDLKQTGSNQNIISEVQRVLSDIVKMKGGREMASSSLLMIRTESANQDEGATDEIAKEAAVLLEQIVNRTVSGNKEKIQKGFIEPTTALMDLLETVISDEM